MELGVYLNTFVVLLKIKALFLKASKITLWEHKGSLLEINLTLIYREAVLNQVH